MAKQLPWLLTTQQDGMHCVCPDGFTGLECDVLSKKCGKRLWCYNGSECKETTMEDGTIQKYCDCSEANNETASFAGIGCQHQSGVFCSSNVGQSQEMSFCVNGGECFENGKQ